MWVSDDYHIKANDTIDLRLVFKALKAGEAKIQFRCTAFDNYIDADDIAISISKS